MRVVGTPLERALAKVDVADCWEWQAGLDRDGYARIGVDRTAKLAHRVVYEALVGPIPEGMTIDHLCRSRSCLNPDHLEVVTTQMNTARRKASRSDRGVKRVLRIVEEGE